MFFHKMTYEAQLGKVSYPEYLAKRDKVLQILKDNGDRDWET